MKPSFAPRAAAIALARALCTSLVIGVSFTVSLALLRYWHLPGGDEPSSGALLAKASPAHHQTAQGAQGAQGAQAAQDVQGAQLARQEAALRQPPQQVGVASPAVMRATDVVFISTPNE